MDTVGRLRRTQSGVMLIEVLVAVLLCAFALLGFVALQARASAAEFEALQRSQALVLVDDMKARLNANRANAGSYVGTGLIGGGAVESCGGKVGAALDLCEWANLIRGSTETRAGTKVGAMVSARGCISRATGSTDRYLIAVAWQGVAATGGPPSTCGQGDATFPDEAMRRVVSSTVCIALLRDAAVPSATPRC